MRKNKAVMHEPLLIPRVKKYLEDNVHQTYVNVASMALELQTRYKDYNRRKAVPFRTLVEHAYQAVLESYGLDSNPSSDDAPSDVEMEDQSSNRRDHMNNALINMYAKNKEMKAIGPNDGELIDISSDESADEGQKQQLNDENKKKAAVNNVQNSKSSAEADCSCNPPTVKKRKIDNPELGLLKATKPRRYKKEIVPKYSWVTFKNVGGIEHIQKELCELLLHFKHPEVFLHIGLPPPRGILLHGPPGSGKTLLAQSIAGQLGVHFFEVPATELIAGVSGESEERIRDVFDQALNFRPCVLFIDEIDAISTNRENAQKDMERRMVSQLLSCLDSLMQSDPENMVLVVGATSRADSLDPALRRAGRFDHELSLGIPDRLARSQILNILCEPLMLQTQFNFDELAKLTPGYVGADLLGLTMRAATMAIKRVFSNSKRFVGPIPVINLDDELVQAVECPIPTVPEMKEQGVQDKTATDAAPVVIPVDEVAIVGEPATVENEKDKSINDYEAITANSDLKDNMEIITPNAESMDVMLDRLLSEHTMEKPVELEKTDSIAPIEPVPIEPKINPVSVAASSRRQNPSLKEMLTWLTSNVLPISGDELEQLVITMEDFKDALKFVKPSAKREGFITVPDVTWEDIGSLQDIREELKLAVLAPVKYPNKLRSLGLSSPSGVLLCGPPGCGKTLLAKAIANEAGINFISVKGPELLNMYVGESERAVRQCFQRARNSAPCVIFFDEFDALCPRRSDGAESGSGGARVVNQLLTEMDGIEERRGVFLMAATNRPDIVDPAVLRPGRLDKILFIGLPNVEDRCDILRAVTKGGTKPMLGDDVRFEELAQLTPNFSGADLAGLVRQASLNALKESLAGMFDGPDMRDAADCDSETDENIIRVERHNFLTALESTRPSVSPEDIRRYDVLRLKYTMAATNKSL